MSSSVWPTPTVSMMIRWKPKASSRSATSSVVVASPPWAPRVAIDRMNTLGSRLTDSMRIRSPSSAPPVNGLVGSTATTPTESPPARNRWMSASVSVLLPAPGGPVMPIRRVPPRPSSPWACDSTRSNPSRWFSTRVMARAKAAGSRRASPSRIRSTLMQGNYGVGGTSCLLLGAVQGYGPHRSRPHGDAFDPRRRGREDIELEAMEGEPLAGPRNTAQRAHQQAPHGLDARDRERDAERLLQPAGRGASLELDDPRRRLNPRAPRGLLRRLEDLGYQVAQEVLEGDEPRRAAELVQHDGEVATAALHLEHQVGGARRSRDDERRVHGDRGVGRKAQQVEGVRDAHDLVERPAIHRIATVPGLQRHVSCLRGEQPFGDRHDGGPRRHQLPHWTVC